MIETREDLAVMLDVDAFGSPATYTCFGGDGVALIGLFEAGDGKVFEGPGMVTGRQRRFVCITADLPAGAARGDMLTVGDENFTVQVIRADGTGLTILELEAE